ncbi:succinylglutamate desuccinylase [Alteromonas aestuariivivens]|uniref:Succinylglutamate desuccinylase n=1 Tax=Alteromonas aestuariivivens TaxID=1938339 RepID=A0A3D8MBF6_9ALTE|nr:succinylglutamate desuccinylase [Alteromonas aestuariivivens]RDV27557.1 succinylglutamate desuccinylase [Alteromonas aestuariivivens]
MTISALARGEFLSVSRLQPELLASVAPFTLPNGTSVSIPAAGIISFEPPVQASPARHVVLSCGVHGNETAPIEICDELVKRVLTGDLLLCHRVLFLFGNLPAMDLGERFVEENMNRLFSGAHSMGPGLVNEERRRARALEQAVSDFYAGGSDGVRLHYDLHTAIRASKNEKFAVYPYLHERRHSLSQLAFLAECGVRTVLLSESPTTTFSYYSSYQHQAHGFTVELGKVQPFGQNDMSRFEAAKMALTRLVSEADFAPRIKPDEVELFRVNQVINKHQEDFVLHFADDTPNFTDFAAGTLLASESGAQYRAEYNGEAIVFPNARVAIGQRALLTVVPTQLEEWDV